MTSEPMQQKPGGGERRGVQRIGLAVIVEAGEFGVAGARHMGDLGATQGIFQ